MSLISVHRFVVACGVVALVGYGGWALLRGGGTWTDVVAGGGSLAAGAWFAWYWTTIPSRYGPSGGGGKAAGASLERDRTEPPDRT